MSLGFNNSKTGRYALISLEFHIINVLVVLIEKLNHLHNNDFFFII